MQGHDCHHQKGRLVEMVGKIVRKDQFEYNNWNETTERTKMYLKNIGKLDQCHAKVCIY